MLGALFRHPAAHGIAPALGVIGGLLLARAAGVPLLSAASLLYVAALAGLAWAAWWATARARSLEVAAREAEQRLREHEGYLLGASHELRSPLGKAMMALQYVLDAADGGRHPIGQAALFELNRLMVTLENMLELARMGTGHAAVTLQDVDPVELVRQRVTAAQGDEGGHVVTIDVQDGAGAMRTDPARLAQVLDNLLSNAIKYSPERSDVRVSVAATPTSVRIAVRDRGPGIRPEDRERIFDQYYRAPDTRHVSGAGLGLFISRELVRILGGRIEVESAPGRGSEFRVILPRGAPRDGASPPLPPEAWHSQESESRQAAG